MPLQRSDNLPFTSNDSMPPLLHSEPRRETVMAWVLQEQSHNSQFYSQQSAYFPQLVSQPPRKSELEQVPEPWDSLEFNSTQYQQLMSQPSRKPELEQVHEPWEPLKVNQQAPQYLAGLEFTAVVLSPELANDHVSDKTIGHSEMSKRARANLCDKSKLSKWQKAFRIPPLWKFEAFRKTNDPNWSLLSFGAKRKRELPEMEEGIIFVKEDQPFLTIHEIHFGGIWFNMEVIKMINITGLVTRAVVAAQPATTEPIPRVIGTVEESTSLDSETVWSEDDSDESEGSFGLISSINVHSPSHQIVVGSSSIRPTLAASKTKLINRLMKEFWILFDQITLTNVVGCTGTSTSIEAIPSSSSSTSLTSSSPLKGVKRSLDDGNNQESDDENNRRVKRPKKGPILLNSGNNRPGFACPYRKHNPRKYNVSEWRPCALTPHNTIARVKYISLSSFHQKMNANTVLKGTSLQTPSNISVSTM